jgi:DNA-binding XRE family transcriptional regulator
MLELTKKPHTEGMVSLTVVVPAGRADAVTMAIKEALEPNVPADQVFPESSPGEILRGARGLREMTQVQLAKLAGVRPAHISDMENGRRSISKEMARKLGHVLDLPYKAFL